MQSVFSSQIVLRNLGSNAIDNCNVFYDQLVKCSHLANRIDIVVKISDDDINQQVFLIARRLSDQIQMPFVIVLVISHLKKIKYNSLKY